MGIIKIHSSSKQRGRSIYSHAHNNCFMQLRATSRVKYQHMHALQTRSDSPITLILSLHNMIDGGHKSREEKTTLPPKRTAPIENQAPSWYFQPVDELGPLYLTGASDRSFCSRPLPRFVPVPFFPSSHYQLSRPLQSISGEFSVLLKLWFVIYC